MIGRLRRAFARKHGPVHARATVTGAPITWYQCGTHGGVAIGSPTSLPGHCRLAWNHPRTVCGDWEPTSRGRAMQLTHEALR